MKRTHRTALLLCVAVSVASCAPAVGNSVTAPGDSASLYFTKTGSGNTTLVFSPGSSPTLRTNIYVGGRNVSARSSLVEQGLCVPYKSSTGQITGLGCSFNTVSQTLVIPLQGSELSANATFRRSGALSTRFLYADFK